MRFQWDMHQGGKWEGRIHTETQHSRRNRFSETNLSVCLEFDLFFLLEVLCCVLEVGVKDLYYYTLK